MEEKAIIQPGSGNAATATLAGSSLIREMYVHAYMGVLKYKHTHIHTHTYLTLVSECYHSRNLNSSPKKVLTITKVKNLVLELATVHLLILVLSGWFAVSHLYREFPVWGLNSLQPCE